MKAHQFWVPDPTRPPSGAIPRFPVWEVSAMLAAVLAGVTALLDPSAGRLTGLVGSTAAVFYCCLIVGGVLALVGMLMRAPTGLVVQLVAQGVLAVVTAAIAVGVAVDIGKPVYSGSTFLWLIAAGGTWRAGQILGQLWRAYRLSRDSAGGCG